MKNLPLALMLILIQLLHPGGLSGQNNWTEEKARQVSEEARAMAVAGNREQAFNHLDQNISAMENREELASYRAYLLFSKAWLLQNLPDGEEKENLRLAQAAYEEALNSQPGDRKILNNLVLVSRSLEDWEKAERYAGIALQTDSLQSADWHIVLGDISKSRGEPESAWTSYSAALKEEAGNREAAQKLLSLYENYDYSNTDRLFQKCLELKENGMAEMALTGLEDIISKVCRASSTVEEPVILAWAGILAANDWVRPRREKQLEQLQCTYEPLIRLKSNIAEGWPLELDNSDWWKQNDRRHFHYLALQKSWADYLLSIGEKKKAMERYQSARRASGDIGSDFSREIYGRDGVLEMELLIQLARLYGDRELDPTGRNFEQMENELFNRKGEAYRSNDLESIQKFHTILAMIYVDRKKWEGGFAGNARFQLTRAIATAERRAQQDPALYTPLPHLHKSLGDTYTAIGDHEDAAGAYLNAAIGYLETDNLSLSEEMIQNADQHINRGSNRNITEKRADVQSILTTRKGIEALSAGAFDKNSEQYFRKNADYEWLDKPARIRTIDPAVVQRQAFKALADLGTKARKVGAIEEGSLLRQEANAKVREVSVLSSQQDVLRLKEFDPSIQYRESIPNKDQKEQNEIILPNKSRIIKVDKAKG